MDSGNLGNGKDETKEYILHRLNCAINGQSKAKKSAFGHPIFEPFFTEPQEKIFEPAAFNLIYRFSGGLPRLINKVCDHALFIGFVSEAKVISHSIVEEAINELRFREERKDEQILQST